jgi:hypothetical protein
MTRSLLLAIELYKILFGSVALIAAIAVPILVCLPLFAEPHAPPHPYRYRAPTPSEPEDESYGTIRARATDVDTAAMAYNSSLREIARRVPVRATEAADAKRTSDVIYDPAHDRWSASTPGESRAPSAPVFNPDVTLLSL